MTGKTVIQKDWDLTRQEVERTPLHLPEIGRDSFRKALSERVGALWFWAKFSPDTWLLSLFAFTESWWSLDGTETNQSEASWCGLDTYNEYLSTDLQPNTNWRSCKNLTFMQLGHVPEEGYQQACAGRCLLLQVLFTLSLCRAHQNRQLFTTPRLRFCLS